MNEGEAQPEAPIYCLRCKAEIQPHEAFGGKPVRGRVIVQWEDAETADLMCMGPFGGIVPHAPPIAALRAHDPLYLSQP